MLYRISGGKMKRGYFLVFGLLAFYLVSVVSVGTSVTIDTTPPIISNVSVGKITENSAYIHWVTDEMSDSLVKYGIHSGKYTSIQLGETWEDDSFYWHNAKLTGLKKNNKYYFVVKSTDLSGNSAQSGEYTFTTLKPTNPPHERWVVRLPSYSFPSFANPENVTYVIDTKGLQYVILNREGVDYYLVYVFDGTQLEASIDITSYRNNVDISKEIHGNSTAFDDYSIRLLNHNEKKAALKITRD